MKYFVTGATGFIGGRVARMLLEDGHEVVAFARTRAKAIELEQAGAIIHKGDITDKESMREGMEGVDGIFHLAAWYEIGKNSQHAHSINVEGTRNVLELMAELAIPRGVYTSTLAVYSDTGGKLVTEDYRFNGPFLSEYEKTKWQAHYEIAEPMVNDGLPLIIVHPGVVYGPGDTSSVRKAFLDYLQGKMPGVPGKTAFAWGHVDDTARAHILAMEKGIPGENYNICGPACSMVDAFKLAESITGVKAPKMVMPPWLLRVLAGMVSVFEGFVTFPPDYTSEGLRSVAGVTYLGSNEKARKALGFDPRPLEEGLRETLLHEMKLLGMEIPATS